VQLFTFWSFAPLTYVERLCLTSMVRAGHRVDLYTYDGRLDVPVGVALRDARELFARDKVVSHAQTGSPALFTDLFRYAGLQRGLGTWVDTDVILLRGIADMGDYIFGFESPDKLNGAVLRLPSDCPYLAYIDALVAAPVPMPRHWSITKKLRQLARALIGRQRRLAELEWGVIGPLALTAFARRNGWLSLAQPEEVFYPVHWRERAMFFGPAELIEQRITPATRAIHLWHMGFTKDQKVRPPAGSFLARMCERYGIATPD
jgi:hypothetical protein